MRLGMDDNFSRFRERTGAVRLHSNRVVAMPSILVDKDIRAVERNSPNSGVTSGALLHADTIAKHVLAGVRWWHGGRFRSTELSS